MILQLSCKGHGIGLRLPAPVSDVEQTLSTLRDGFEKNAPVQISSVCGNAYSLHRYIRHADLEDEGDLQKLNRLAELFDGMGVEQQHIFAGALDAESINGLDDVLRTASSLAQYEFIEGVSSDKELGGWLVEHGLAEADFPEAVRPYLDYAGIGAEYYASHGGAYTPNGYVKRRDTPQEQSVAEESKFSLTLMSISDTYRLNLPTSDDELERARQALKVSSLDEVILSDTRIDYLWEHLVPLDGVTLDGADVFAQYVQQMSKHELRVFGAALEVEEPSTFNDAMRIAEDTNQRKATRYNSQSVLSGLLVCGDCGRNYRRITRPSGEVVWRCANRVEHGKRFCKHSPSIPEEQIKDAVCEKLGLTAFDEQAAKEHIDLITIRSNGILGIEAYEKAIDGPRRKTYNSHN